MLKIILILLYSLTLFGSDIVRFGYHENSIERFKKIDMKITSDIWLKGIGKKLNMGIESTIYDNPEDIAQDLNEGKVDYVTGPGLMFVKYFDLSLLDDGFTQGFINGEKEVFIILVQKNSTIKNLSDLKNLPIGIQKYDDIMRLYLELNLAKKTNSSLQMKEFSLRRHVLHKLFFGKIKAAVVTNKSFELAKELNPQIGEKLKVLLETDLDATGFGFMRKSLDESIKQKMLNAAKNIHEDTRGKQLLTLYKTEIVVDSKVEELKPFEDFYKQSLQLQSKHNK